MIILILQMMVIFLGYVLPNTYTSFRPVSLLYKRQSYIYGKRN